MEQIDAVLPIFLSLLSVISIAIDYGIVQPKQRQMVRVVYRIRGQGLHDGRQQIAYDFHIGVLLKN